MWLFWSFFSATKEISVECVYVKSQMEAIVFIIHQIFFATRAVSKIGGYSRGIFGHVTRLAQWLASENI